MSRDVIAYINRLALQHNFNIVKQLAPQAAILAMVKSNGYGHGLLSVAHTLSEADALGVACIEEAIALREAQITTPIVVMSGFSNAEEFALFVRYQLGIVLHQPHQLELLIKQKLAQPLWVWLKIDTGMHRLGFPLSVAAEVYQRLQGSANTQKPILMMTHLANADQSATYTEQQLAAFFRVLPSTNAVTSMANSAAILRYPAAHGHWVRPGIMLYGVSPFAEDEGHDYGLQPVMTLRAKLIAINAIKKGDWVGYGCTWQAPENMRIGIVGIGYGDGYPRHATSGTPVLLHNTICPLVGRVSMDMIAIDLRPCPTAQINDVVTLWGEGLPIEDVARYATSIGYELLCHVTQRVKFISSNENG